jgi:hypothetical protein
MPWRPRGEVDVQLYSFFNIGAGSGWVVNATPQPLYPQERPDAHCVGGWVGRTVVLDGAENLSPPGFELWTVQLIAVRYTVYDITALFSDCEGIFLNSRVATNLDTTCIKWKHNHSIVSHLIYDSHIKVLKELIQTLVMTSPLKFVGLVWSCKKVTQPLYRPWGFQEVKALRFHDSRRMKMVRLSTPRTGRLYPPGNIYGTHFC